MTWSVLRRAVLGQFSPTDSRHHQNPIRDRLVKRRTDVVDNEMRLIYEFDNVKVRVESVPPTKATLADRDAGGGFLNTGLMRVWPCEELLAYYVATSQWLCNKLHAWNDGLRLLELGAGTSGLAGVALAKCATRPVIAVHLTDGNVDCVPALKRNAALNGIANTKAYQLLWSESHAMDHQFDVIVAADCVYETALHEVLLITIRTYLARCSSSVAIIMAPPRGQSLRMFRQRAEEGGWFVVEECQEWEALMRDQAVVDDVVDLDIHRPHVLKLRRAPLSSPPTL